MYIACRELVLSNGERVGVGQPVPEALSWSYPALVANLNLGWIKWIDDASDKQIAQATKVAVPADPVAKCGKCGRDFKTERALKIHLSSHR